MEKKNDENYKLLFLGSKEFGLEVFEHILALVPKNICAFATVDDSEDSRSKINEIKLLCTRESIPVEVISGKMELEKCIGKYKPDICFVVCWYSLIPEELLSSVPNGFIGIHNSKLPSYRGQSPLVWQIINGEEKAGFSIFSFTPGMDDGDIWYQDEVEIEKDDYISDIMLKIQNKVLTFIDRKLPEMLNGKIKPYPQKNVNISYSSKRTVEDGLINWTDKNESIYNFIRAQSKPYPGAFTIYKGQKVIIWKSYLFPFPIYGAPGQIGMINKEDGELVIVCGDMKGLVIKEIEVEGQLWKAAEYIKSLKYKFGINENI